SEPTSALALFWRRKMKNQILLTTFVLTICSFYANANQVALTDPSFESTVNFFATYADGNTGTPGGWFTDAPLTTQARRQGPLAPGSFWGSMLGQDGVRAALTAQFNIEPMSNRGATIYQAVYLEAGNTYTLTVGVGTAKGSLN